jgi:drug/metabolite transporter (DMT)-like permease
LRGSLDLWGYVALVYGATLIAALLPGIRERPSVFTLIGGAFVLGGILVAERRRQP